MTTAAKRPFTPTELPNIEEEKWREARGQVLRSSAPLIDQALDVLAEQVAVLRMMNAFSGGPAKTVFLTAQGAGRHVVSEDALDISLAAMHAAVQELSQSTPR